MSASEDLTLEERFALAIVPGLLSRQLEEPDPDWIATWTWQLAKKMADEARRQRKRATKKGGAR